MRIGLFTDAFEPIISGVSVSINILRRELEKLGHEVIVTCIGIYVLTLCLDEDFGENSDEHLIRSHILLVFSFDVL